MAVDVFPIGEIVFFRYVFTITFEVQMPDVIPCDDSVVIAYLCPCFLPSLQRLVQDVFVFMAVVVVVEKLVVGGVVLVVLAAVSAVNFVVVALAVNLVVVVVALAVHVVVVAAVVAVVVVVVALAVHVVAVVAVDVAIGDRAFGFLVHSNETGACRNEHAREHGSTPSAATGMGSTKGVGVS